MESELFINNNLNGKNSQPKSDSNFTIHRLVWNNNVTELRKYLNENKGCYDIEERDLRGRTPLHLAIALDHLESATVLLEDGGASALAENSQNWTVVQEAVSTGDPEMVQLCLQYRDYQRHMERVHGVHRLLQQLAESPDFYVEMRWEFTSWLPFVSKICPSDNYKVWKSGSNVRIDTTLLGFDNYTWERGRRSYLFKLNGNNVATLLEIDNDNCQIYSETLDPSKAPPTIAYMCPSNSAVAARLTSPIVTSYVDVDKISFERTKSGVWGWRSDKTDVVDNFTCKVFSASNVQFATKTRTEHLSEDDKRKMKKQSNRTPFESFLGVAETDASKSTTMTSSICRNPCHVTEEEYFTHPSSHPYPSSTSSAAAILAATGGGDNSEDGGCGSGGGGNDVKDIGRPIEQTSRIQKFKSRFWLCDDYPLSLPDQVVPIIDLMAANNTHFRKLKDFIALQLPAGFPVKIEIPVFHVLNARITFSNIFSRDVPVKGVTPIPGEEAGSIVACTIDDSIFSVPSSYSVIGELHHERLQDEDDELYQYAMRESMMQQMDNGNVYQDNQMKRTQSNHTRITTEEERLLQWALEESLKESRSWDQLPPTSVNQSEATPTTAAAPVAIGDDDDDGGGGVDNDDAVGLVGNSELYDEQLRLALELSQKQVQEEMLMRQREDEEMMRILELSLIEK